MPPPSSALISLTPQAYPILSYPSVAVRVGPAGALVVPGVEVNHCVFEPARLVSNGNSTVPHRVQLVEAARLKTGLTW